MKGASNEMRRDRCRIRKSSTGCHLSNSDLGTPAGSALRILTHKSKLLNINNEGEAVQGAVAHQAAARSCLYCACAPLVIHAIYRRQPDGMRIWKREIFR